MSGRRPATGAFSIIFEAFAHGGVDEGDHLESRNHDVLVVIVGIDRLLIDVLATLQNIIGRTVLLTELLTLQDHTAATLALWPEIIHLWLGAIELGDVVVHGIEQ